MVVKRRQAAIEILQILCRSLNLSGLRQNQQMTKSAEEMNYDQFKCHFGSLRSMLVY